MEKGDIQNFQTGQRWSKLSLKTEFRPKLKLFEPILGRHWTVVKSVVVGVLFLSFMVYAKV